jgi:hypothetical protein
MALYAIYNKAGGALVSTGAFNGDPGQYLDQSLGFAAIAALPDLNSVWNPVTHVFDIAPAGVKTVLESTIDPVYQRWLKWRTLLTEATARGMSAPVIAALQAIVNSAWADVVTAVTKWYNAQ